MKVYKIIQRISRFGDTYWCVTYENGHIIRFPNTDEGKEDAKSFIEMKEELGEVFG